MKRALVVSWRRFQVMIVKELLELGRDSFLLFFMVYAFTADIYLAGSGISLELRNANMTVHDGDRSFASRELISRFQPPHFAPPAQVQDAGETTRMLDRGDTMIVMDIPPQFERDLASGRQASVQLQVDATNSVLAILASSYAAQIAGEFGVEAGLKANGLDASALKDAPQIQDDHRVWYNPNQDDSWFMSITELLTIVTVLTIVLPAAALVREKEKGTVEQLLVSPLSAFQIMFPKIVSMTLVILCGTALSLFGILGGVFHVPFRGSLPLFFAVTALYVFTVAGLGLLAATVARNLAQVGMITILILAPMLFLSGAWTPPEAMPGWLRTGMLISPLHYYIDASFGILLKGSGLRALWKEVLGIAVLGGLVFSHGMWRLRRQLR